MRRAVALVLVSLAFGAHPLLAQTTDQPISGAKLVLKQSASGKQKLSFSSRDPGTPFPASGGDEDPLLVGATVEIITPGAPAGGPFPAPPNSTQPGWVHPNGGNPYFRYKRDKAYATTTSLKTILIKQGHGLTIQGEATGIPLDGARGLVSIRITIGDLRICARFDGAAVTKDAVGQFQGKNASAAGIDNCGTAALTGEPPLCTATAECNGEHCTIPGFENLPCGPTSPSNSCQCCSDGFPAAAPCCNPSSIAIIYPPMQKTCTPTGCTAPYTCRDGDECRPDETCCTTNADNLCIMAYAPPFSYMMVPLVPCCAGLECSRYALPEGGAKCCASGGTSCTGGGDCCTGHCQLDGTCESCRTGGVACGNAQECCSGSCTGSVCDDACAPTGTFCTSGATCCSGTCENFQCQP